MLPHLQEREVRLSDSGEEPHLQLLHSSFQASPTSLAPPDLSVHWTGAGSGSPRTTPGNITPSPPSPPLGATVLVFSGTGAQNLLVQPGRRLSVHRHRLHSCCHVSPACRGNPLSFVPHRLVPVWGRLHTLPTTINTLNSLISLENVLEDSFICPVHALLKEEFIEKLASIFADFL